MALSLMYESYSYLDGLVDESGDLILREPGVLTDLGKESSCCY